VIEVQNVQYTYPSAGHPAVQGLSFAIQPGEIFGFLGPSGAGKSTTQKILTGLLKEYRGQVQVFGRDLSAWGPDYYERIGVSFELPNHYLRLTALENLTYFRSLYSSATRSPAELLELVGLSGDARTLVGQFSKGMKNRLTFARALLNNPELLFLDEPTSGLDPMNARRVKDIIRDQQRQGKTIFLTTHDMQVAGELCDRVAFLVEGQIALVDAPRALQLRFGAPTVRVEFGSNGQPKAQEFPLAGLADNPAFLALLRQSPVQTIHTQEATLEKIFIHVTGRSLL
jgi:fluoroquinolone transport system ATP-binding protein